MRIYNLINESFDRKYGVNKNNLKEQDLPSIIDYIIHNFTPSDEVIPFNKYEWSKISPTRAVLTATGGYNYIASPLLKEVIEQDLDWVDEFIGNAILSYWEQEYGRGNFPPYKIEVVLKDFEGKEVARGIGTEKDPITLISKQSSNESLSNKPTNKRLEEKNRIY